MNDTFSQSKRRGEMSARWGDQLLMPRSGGTNLKTLPMEDWKRSLSWNGFKRRLQFKYLFLLCVILLLFYSIWEHTLFLRQNSQWLTDETHYAKAPHNRVHPKHQVKLDENNPSNMGNAGGKQYHLAYPQNYHFLMDVGDVCESRTPFLVLMVPVEPKNVVARDAIRSTWGKEKVVQGKKVLTLFMLGLAEGPNLQQENELHGDLIQSDFRDTYRNLTIKTMVIMDWLATRCPTAAYAMKIDSDMFLNIDNLVLMLQKPDIPPTDYLTGHLMRNSLVIRRKSSKWYVSEEMFPDRVYPLYALGMGYVFSNDLPRKLVEISKRIKPFDFEDVYVGMCMKKLGLALTPPPDPSQFRTYDIKFKRCTYSKIITSILESPTQLIDFWGQLKMAPGPPC